MYYYNIASQIIDIYLESNLGIGSMPREELNMSIGRKEEKMLSTNTAIMAGSEPRFPISITEPPAIFHIDPREQGENCAHFLPLSRCPGVNPGH